MPTSKRVMPWRTLSIAQGNAIQVGGLLATAALAKYAGQPEIDANVVELVAAGERRAEPILSQAGYAADSRSIRTAGSGRPSQRPRKR